MEHVQNKFDLIYTSTKILKILLLLQIQKRSMPNNLQQANYASINCVIMCYDVF